MVFVDVVSQRVEIVFGDVQTLPVFLSIPITYWSEGIFLECKRDEAIGDWVRGSIKKLADLMTAQLFRKSPLGGCKNATTSKNPGVCKWKWRGR